jgi:serine/threonine-protein kinase
MRAPDSNVDSPDPDIQIVTDEKEGLNTVTDGQQPIRTIRFGKYHLIGKLGHGGMAEVFLAMSLGKGGFRKLVVIKRLHAELAEENGFVEMFLDEARLAARLTHPNIAQCYEIDEYNGFQFMAMEYVGGEALDRVRRKAAKKEKELPIPVVLYCLTQVLEGLSYAHDLKEFDGTPLQIVHRDVSPSNIFVGYDGRVKLLDFGVAKAAIHVVQTRAGVVKGKFAYMAPEQARGKPVDPRADLWSVGVLLWEALAGRRLFKGMNEMETLRLALQGETPDLAEIAPQTSLSLSSFLEKALQRNPDERFQTAAEMKEALEAAAAEGPGLASKNEVAAFIEELFKKTIKKNNKVLQACLTAKVETLSTNAENSLLQEPSLVLSRASLTGQNGAGSDPHFRFSLTPTSGMSFQHSSTGSHQLPSSSQSVQTNGTTGRAVWILVILVAFVLGSATFLYLYRNNQGGLSPTAVAQPLAPPVLEPTPEPEPTPVDPNPIAIPVTNVEVLLHGIPEGSQITVDGRPVEGPRLVWSKSADTHSIVVSAEGYHSWQGLVAADQDRTIEVTMKQRSTARQRRRSVPRRPRRTREKAPAASTSTPSSGSHSTTFGAMP